MPGIKNTVEVLFDMVGKEGKRVLEKKEFLDSVAKIDEKFAKQIEKGIEGVENPTFELSGKATANYNVASIKIKNAQGEVVGGGACSTADMFTKYPTLKSRLDLPNGKSYRGKNTTQEHFKIKDNDGCISIYDKKSGELVAKNKMDTSIVDKKVLKDKFSMTITEMNAEGEEVIRTSFYSNASNGSMCITKNFPDGGTIHINGSARFSRTKIYSPDYYSIEYNNPFSNKNVRLDKVVDGARVLSLSDGSTIFLDSNLNITTVWDLPEFEIRKLVGKPLTKELQKELGVKEVFDAMKDIPTQEEYIKMAQNFPNSEAGKWAATLTKKSTSKTVEPITKENAEKLEKCSEINSQAISPEVKKERIIRDTVGMKFSKLISSLFQRKQKNSELTRDKFEMCSRQTARTIPTEVWKEKVIRDTAG